MDCPWLVHFSGGPLPDQHGSPARRLTRLRHRGRPARVLLYVEDPLFCEVVRTALQRLDRIEVLEAADVSAAADLVMAETADIVVLDGDAGDPASLVGDVERLVRVGDDVSLIVLLAEEDPVLIGTLLDAGVTSCVSKSVYPSDLGAVIRQAARGMVFHRPEALVGGTTDPSADLPPKLVVHDPALTRRELEILRLARDGVGNKEIARDLWITEQTVKFHLSNVYRKLGVSNRTRASRVAENLDLLSLAVLVGAV
jgi:DNA-binding NarL/FixJ family response regulator